MSVLIAEFLCSSDSGILHKDIASLPGFDGALQHLKINGKIHYKEIASALALREIHRYEGAPCGTSVLPPCANEGLCLPRLSSFVCLCSGQFSGKTCEKRNVVSFTVYVVINNELFLM